MLLSRRIAATWFFLLCAALGARAQLLTEPVGTMSAVQTATVTMTAGGTLNTINVLTLGAPNLDFKMVNGGSCAVGAPYSANQTCTVNYTFTPTHPGLRFGGISLSTSGAVVLGNAYVDGLGTGPQVIYSPASQSLLGGTYSYPTGVAVDAAGDVFLTDESANAVYEISNGVSRQIASPLLPDDVAVDGSGNVFVIFNRTSLEEIQAVNGVIPNAPAVNVIASNFSGLNGMKVDGNGNVYLAEGTSGGGSSSMIQEVLAVNGSIPAKPTVLTLVTGVGEPTGVAVDAAGNVYFSDQTGSAYEALAVGGVIPATPTVVALATGLNIPTNIALDAAGDVLVSLQGGIAEIVAVNGVIPASPTVLNLGSNIVFAQGLAVDASGNVLIADDGTPEAVKLDFADAPSLTFATTQVGSTSTDSPQTVTLMNDGNANLVVLPPVSGTNPSITAGFTFTSTCLVLDVGPQIAYAVPEGDSCAESISFTPVVAGPNSGKFTLTDNNLNVTGAQQNILLNGTGTTEATTLTLTSSANPAYVLQSITITALLTGSARTPNGNGIGGQTINLSYTVLGVPYNIPLFTNSAGSASFTMSNGLPAGSTTFTATFAATSSLQASSASLIEVVNLNPTASVLSVSPNPPVVNTAVTLTATVTSSTTTTPVVGTVNFYNGATLLGSGAVSNGTAMMQISTLPLGPETLSCTFLGNAVFATSSCTPISLTVEPPPDFSLTATPATITIETQHHGTMPLSLTSIGLFAGPVQLGCQGPLPPYVTCELPSSETLAAGQTLNFNFTMDTDQILNFLAKDAPARDASAAKRILFALLLPLALTGFMRRRKALRIAMVLVVLVACASGLTACADKYPQHTPPGVYTIPVVGIGTTASGTVITHTLNVTLTVTP